MGKENRQGSELSMKTGNFEAFRTKAAELKEAYDKMKGVKNKPDFMDVYTRVSNVVEMLGIQRDNELSHKEKIR